MHGQSSAITHTVLANGMRVIEMPMQGRLAAAVSIVFAAGSRHEHADEIGVAHLLEHLAFKGTEKHRTARDLNRAAEYLGSEMSGGTTTDYVELSAAVQAESVMAMLDLLSDLGGRPLLQADHLPTERTVILQEIADEQDDPAYRADARLDKALFAGHRLGMDIAGDVSHVQSLTIDQVRGFYERQWNPQNGLAVIAGNLDYLDRDLLSELLLRIGSSGRPTPLPPPPPFVRRVEVEEHESDVVHLRLAYPITELTLSESHNRAVAEVYSDLLGGPMGSRLFEDLREEHGLCYWVDGYVWGYGDALSFLSVDCSVHPSDLLQTLERIERIVMSLGQHRPTEEEVLRARAYAVGTLVRTYESTHARANHAVELVMEYDDEDVDPLRYLAEISSVSVKEVQELAAMVKSGPCVGCVGPINEGVFL